MYIYMKTLMTHYSSFSNYDAFLIKIYLYQSNASDLNATSTQNVFVREFVLNIFARKTKFNIDGVFSTHSCLYLLRLLK